MRLKTPFSIGVMKFFSTLKEANSCVLQANVKTAYDSLQARRVKPAMASFGSCVCHFEETRALIFCKAKTNGAWRKAGMKVITKFAKKAKAKRALEL